MATDAQVTDLLEQQADLNASLANRDQFVMKWISGSLNQGFDKDGKPASDPSHGPLGYYPILNANGEPVYLPCIQRVAQDGSSSAMSVFEPDPVPDSTITLMNLNQYAGKFAGFSGSYVIVPVVEDGEETPLENQESVLLPLNGKPAVRLFTEVGEGGVSVLLGASNSPLPPLPGPQEPLDLGEDGYVYAKLGEVTPLNISVGALSGEFDIITPLGLPIVTITPFRTWTPTNAGMTVANPAPDTDPTSPTDNRFFLDGDALVAPVIAYWIRTSPAAYAEFEDGGMWFRGPPGNSTDTVGFSTQGLGLDFPANNDPLLNKVPNRLRVNWTGKVMGGYAFLAAIGTYNVGEMRLEFNGTDGYISCSVTGAGGGRGLQFPVAGGLNNGEHTYSVEFRNNPDTLGGFMEVWVDGVSQGTKPVEVKLKIDTSAYITINNSHGNYAVGQQDIFFRGISISTDRAGTDYAYEPLTPGEPVTADDIVKLGADARALTDEGNYELSYRVDVEEAPSTKLGIELYQTEISLPPSRAYKVVLERWDTGVGVPHSNELVLTNFVNQNVHFEDSELFANVPPWSECVSQGPYPSINGIAYRAEAIRMGNYVQIMFGYGRDVPSEPFGNPEGFRQQLIPHKWLIYDQYGTLIARIEKPNGSALNEDDQPGVFEGVNGDWDGLGRAIITNEKSYYPRGTVRTAIIWRSHDVVDHDRAYVKSQFVPHDDLPYGSHLSYSNNGLDPRITGGGNSGSQLQMNGYSNWRAMSWQPSTYAELQAQGLATLDPYQGNLYTPQSIVANVGAWLKYTPFNVCGRSTITGPGGGRDDRQAIPGPVAAYILDPAGGRPHDNHPLREIAVDYMTSYASHAFHVMEGGRFGPLFKEDPFRGITMRNHYYGPGEGSTPPSRAFYVQGGRPAELMSATNPLRVHTPGQGDQPNSPYFNFDMIDELHAHQFPAWGSLLWKTPEFAMMQPAFWDQNKLYANRLYRDVGLGRITGREGAWMFLHVALSWKTASNRSSRLYSRQQVMDWFLPEIEYFYDRFYAGEIGFLNPPTGNIPDFNGNVGHNEEGNAWRQQLLYAAWARFGACQQFNSGIIVQSFMQCYWLVALVYAQRMGFIAAMSAASPKAAAVLDWTMAMFRKSALGIINDTTNLGAKLDDAYEIAIWREVRDIQASGGDLSLLPQSWAEVGQKFPPPASPYVRDYYDNNFHFESGTPALSNLDADGDYTDYFFAVPSMLRQLGFAGADIDAAEVKVTAWRNAKMAEQEALGAAAGSYFKFSKTTFQPILPAWPND